MYIHLSLRVRLCKLKINFQFQFIIRLTVRIMLTMRTPNPRQPLIYMCLSTITNYTDGIITEGVRAAIIALPTLLQLNVESRKFYV